MSYFVSATSGQSETAWEGRRAVGVVPRPVFCYDQTQTVMCVCGEGRAGGGGGSMSRFPL